MAYGVYVTCHLLNLNNMSIVEPISLFNVSYSLEAIKLTPTFYLSYFLFFCHSFGKTGVFFLGLDGK